MFYHLSYYIDPAQALKLLANTLTRLSSPLLWLIGDSQTKPGVFQRLRSSWIPIPTGVGITLLALIQWRRLERERNRYRLDIAKDWEISCYKAVPLRSLSRAFGWLTERPVPTLLRPVIYNTYAKTFNVDVEEMAEPFRNYDSMGSFFCRRLKEGVRPIDRAALVSPADGTVLSAGRLTCSRVDQVKGVTYSLQTFLGDVDSRNNSKRSRDQNNNIPPRKTADTNWEEYKNKLVTKKTNELYHCVIYLAPGDYHRFHSPVDWKISYRRHFQGELLSVNPTIARWIPDLFTLNERALYVGSWEHGYFTMTAVGATNVGSIRVYDDKMLHTNTRKWKDCKQKEKRLSCSWKKGEQIGEFRMGSTLVLIFEAPKDFVLDLTPGSRIKVGARLVPPHPLGQSL